MKRTRTETSEPQRHRGTENINVQDRIENQTQGLPATTSRIPLLTLFPIPDLILTFSVVPVVSVVKSTLIASLALALLVQSGVSAAPIRIEGNFDFSGEIRRDEDADGAELGGARNNPNALRPGWHGRLFDPRAEFRAFTNPVPPVEVYAKIFQSNDLFMGEGHTRLRYTWDNSDNEKGFESYFFYRQGRLNLGDPILSLTYDQYGQGIATNWWLGRGQFTVPKGRWSGEVNVQNFFDGFSGEQNTSGEDNDAWAAKIRHDYRHNNDLNFYNEFLYANKIFSAPGFVRQHNALYGTALGVNWKTTSFSAQFNTGESQNGGLDAHDNDAIAFDLRNLVLLDREWSGRVGINANFVKWGRNYTNFLGRTAENLFSVWYEPVPIGLTIQNNTVTQLRDLVRKDLYTEMYWDVPRYDAGLVWRHQDKFGMQNFRDRNIARRNQVEANLKLIYNLEARLQYTRVSWGVEQVLADFDAQRFIRRDGMVTDDYYASLRMARVRYSVKTDARRYVHRRNELWVSGIEGTYKITDRIGVMARFANVWIDRPDLWYAEWGGRSITEPFHRRHTFFAQLQYKPTDNSQFFIEYGQGFHTDNGLSQDGDLLYPGRRDDARIYSKLEMWF